MKPKSKPTAWKQASIDAGFRSEEEWKFWLWLKELEENQVVFNPKYVDKNPDFTWELSPKQTYNLGFKKPKHLFQNWAYNADFKFLGNTKFIPFKPQYLKRLESTPIFGDNYFNTDFLVDIKGSYQETGERKYFRACQKALYDKHGIFVNMVIPDSLFEKTFAPEVLMTQPKRLKPSKYAVYKTCQEWLATIK